MNEPNLENAAIVGTEWLAAHLNDPDIRILDCTWHHVSSNMDGRTQYRGRHLPGSVHFDIDHIADKSSNLPHMLPKPAEFALKVGLLGVGSGDRVIVYDRHCGGSAAARAWWMFRVFGHAEVALLDGGYGKWTKEGRPTDMSPVRPEAREFSASFVPGLVTDLAQIRALPATDAAQLLDARGPAKFNGEQEDLFPGRRLGHIAGSINLPWGDLIAPESGAFLPKDALAARFAAAGVDLARPIVTSCGSGITSCMLALGLYLIGQRAASVYDGSWAEYGLIGEQAAVAA